MDPIASAYFSLVVAEQKEKLLKVKKEASDYVRNLGGKVKNLYNDLETYRTPDKPSLRILDDRKRHDLPEFPKDPYSSLAALKTNINSFHENQGKDPLFASRCPAAPLEQAPPPADPEEILEVAPVQRVAPLPAELADAKGLHPPPEVRDKEALTNRQGKRLATNASLFALFYIFLSKICKIQEEDNSNLYGLIHEAEQTQANGKKIAPWKLFMRTYGKKLSWFQWAKCGLFYLLCYRWIPLIPNTTKAYLNRFLEEMRTRIVKNRESRLNLFEMLINRIDDFFNVTYLQTYTKYAEESPQQPLNAFRQAAIEKLTGKTLDALCANCCRSIEEHLSPKEILFDGFLKRFQNPLNRLIKYVMHKWVIPSVVSTIAQEGTTRDKNIVSERKKLPFLYALTVALTNQLALAKEVAERARNGNREAEHETFSKLKKREGLNNLVDKLLFAIQFAPTSDENGEKINLSPMDVKEELKKIEERKHLPSDDRETKMQKGIEEGILEAANSLFHYLDHPGNAEDLLAKILDAVNAQFSGDLPKSEAEWVEKKREYLQAQETLMTTAKSLFDPIVDQAVEEEIEGMPPEKAEVLAKQAFLQEQTLLQNTLETLSATSREIEEKAHQGQLNEHHNLLPSLVVMKQSLDAFLKRQEELKENLESLTSADREGILVTLMPLFDKANGVMKRVLKLQTLQKTHLDHRQVAEHFDRAAVPLETISRQRGLNSTSSIQAVEKAIKKASAFLDETDPKNPALYLLQEIAPLKQIIEKISNDQKVLDALSSLEPLLHQLANFVRLRITPPRKCLEEIRAKVALLPSKEEREQLLSLIDDVNKYNIKYKRSPRPNFEATVWNPLVQSLQRHQNLINDAIAESQHRLEEAARLPSFAEKLQSYLLEYTRRRNQNLQSIKEESQALKTELASLQAPATPEEQIHIDKERLEGHLAAAGALATFFPYEATALRYFADTAPKTALVAAAAIDLVTLFVPYGLVFRSAASAAGGFYMSQQAAYTIQHAENIASKVKNGVEFMKAAYEQANFSRRLWAGGAAIAGGLLSAATSYVGYGLGPLVSAAIHATAIYQGAQLGFGPPGSSSSEGTLRQSMKKAIASVKGEVRPKVNDTFEKTWRLISHKETNPDFFDGATRLGLDMFASAYPPKG